MCLTGYWHARRLDYDGWIALSEPVPGPSSEALARLARELDMIIGAGLVERADNGRIYNTYVVALPSGELHRHRKLHAFESPHVFQRRQLYGV